MSKQTKIHADKLDLYEKLVAANSNVERKGAAVPYTSQGGHMFSFLTKTGVLALRLPTEVREAFLKKYKTQLCQQHGKVLKEYVEVPQALFKKTSELQNYFDLSYAYVACLKPKPTKRKKTSEKKPSAAKNSPKKKKAVTNKKGAVSKAEKKAKAVKKRR